ncbi:MAG TPA: acyl-CoA dehydrogenase family protein [Trebonia sp.]|jgi:two-component flavin-dependent monooxygenase|nr:acyl-CoA dehydrogenase family protein [Trebonia sp.]
MRTWRPPEASGSALVARAAEVALLAGRGAAEADQERRLPPAVVDAVAGAGFARQFVATRWGGQEGTFLEACAAVSLLAEQCPSTAWTASLAATLGRIAGFLPEAGQRALWAGGPDTLVAGSLLPLGEAIEVDGGWMVSGRWPYVSTIEQARWVLLPAVDRSPAGAGVAWFFALPRGGYAVEQTWNNLGLRATGSHTVVLEPTFVSGGYAFRRSALDEGDPVCSAAATHRLPLEAVAGLAFAPVVVGAAYGALRAWLRANAPRMAAAAAGGRVPVPRPTYDQVLTRSAAELDAAALLVERVARMTDAGGLSPLDVAVSARDCALASELARAVTERLVRATGTSGLAEDQPLERFWRDAHAGASHVMLQLARSAQGYAALALAGQEAGRDQGPGGAA